MKLKAVSQQKLSYEQYYLYSYSKTKTKCFGYYIIVSYSCVHRMTIGRLRVCVGSVLAFYRIRDENRAKIKISFSCGHRVSKSARYDKLLLFWLKFLYRFFFRLAFLDK